MNFSSTHKQIYPRVKMLNCAFKSNIRIWRPKYHHYADSNCKKHVLNFIPMDLCLTIIKFSKINSPLWENFWKGVVDGIQWKIHIYQNNIYRSDIYQNNIYQNCYWWESHFNITIFYPFVIIRYKSLDISGICSQSVCRVWLTDKEFYDWVVKAILPDLIQKKIYRIGNKFKTCTDLVEHNFKEVLQLLLKHRHDKIIIFRDKPDEEYYCYYDD